MADAAAPRPPVTERFACRFYKRLYSRGKGEAVTASRNATLPFAPYPGVSIVFDDGGAVYQFERVSYDLLDGEFYCESANPAWYETEINRSEWEGWNLGG